MRTEADATREMIEIFYEMAAIELGYPSFDLYMDYCEPCQWKGNACHPKKHDDISRGICPLVAQGKIPAVKKAR